MTPQAAFEAASLLQVLRLRKQDSFVAGKPRPIFAAAKLKKKKKKVTLSLQSTRQSASYEYGHEATNMHLAATNFCSSNPQNVVVTATDTGATLHRFHVLSLGRCCVPVAQR